MPIRWTDPALDDFTHICDHSDSHFGPTRGRRTALQIYEALDTLADFPHIGRSVVNWAHPRLVISGLRLSSSIGSSMKSSRSYAFCMAHRSGHELMGTKDMTSMHITLTTKPGITIARTNVED